MRGIRGEPVEVWLRNGRPARFVWRGRMHTVMFVLDRQVRPAATPADADPAPPGPASSGQATGGPATSGPASSGTATNSTGGCECWRVEATPERSVPPATYELCRDLASGRWRLSRS
ncbi:MAG TPA: DUF6504 family protein [Streptosporangiaceae bacterium]